MKIKVFKKHIEVDEQSQAFAMVGYQSQAGVPLINKPS
jgi:hypothetical protein